MVVLLIAFLSTPVFAGHTIAGYQPCTCNTPGCVEDYPGECDGKMQSRTTEAPESTPDSTAELGIALVAILLWLRLKA